MKKRKQILVVEDENSLRLLLSSFLSKRYAVESRKNGLDALVWMSKGNIPDVILLDMEMPILSGSEFLIHIRSSGFFGNIPVLVASGTNDEQMPEKLKKLGANGFLRKPINPSQVVEIIERFLVGKFELV